ncbi:PEP/pyruvate-binding domain-containing protein [Bifidobacterium sp. H6bp22N]|uniref:putative PEP-binding protein n=1 Tax=Bifidobacterium polysaccharolyticum TaxID=2750967 RepID=UPI0028BEF399|nr:putative PEP-binding protein [Bifidobacterium sp. H6bp22N]MDT7507861.1 PEP/pyruvate-binding domain-containing protein [Bifidobacterium sp. H6bp22N]
MRNATEQFVYKLSEGDASMRDLLGGKGAGVAEMTKLGMPVPEGFTITTQACKSYLSGSNDISQEIRGQVLSSLSDLEEATGKRLGDGVNPLLVSVRSGAQVSMPGMMDTILNLGLNQEVVQAVISKTGNLRWAWDSYRRFIQMYSNVVMGVPEDVFEQRLSERKAERQVSGDNDLDAEDMEWLAHRFLDDYQQQEGHEFPTNPTTQLFESIKEVRANADTPQDARRSQELGAEGIGLCRTEHMFFQPDRIEAIRRMIVAADEEERQEALDALLPMQREDFTAMYEALGGRPMTVRLIDPPLHEFLPKTAQAVEALAKATGHTAEEIKDTADELTEVNPMLGHRGSRLAVTYPAIARMQTRAVVEAAIQVKRRHPDWSLAPEIMVPLVSEPAEFKYVKQIVEETANRVIKESGLPMYCSVGTMIETPRAALLAGDIAAGAEFFSFGTNDLTQMTFGLSRDDAGSFLQDYYDKGLLQEDPFSHLDQAGIGRLVEMAEKYGKRTRPNLKVGICGEHGGDPSSIEFCERVGLDYVSCSTYRVPVARLAAAQASLGRHAPERR